MSRIECSVGNCSHNKDNVCYANRVNIGGKSAATDVETCCGSFLNRLLYSDLTNNVNSCGSCNALVCFVNSCTHNENSLCNLDRINVGGDSAQIYNETNCQSFEKK